MGIKRDVKFFLIVLSLITVGELTSEDYGMADYGLFLSPESCFLLNNDKECDIVVTIKWKISKKGDYCLYSLLNKIPLGCWKNQKKATKETLITFKQDINFELRDQKTGKIFFRTSLKLYKKITNLRRKRRNPWSFY